MIDFAKVGQKIAALRKQNGLSQEALAEKLFVTRQALSKWENGSVPSLDVVLELSKTFGVSFEELLCLNEPAPFNVDETDIFRGHDRSYVLNALLTGRLQVHLPEVFPQFDATERWAILKAIKHHKMAADISALLPRLSPAEIRYLKGGH